MINFNVTTESIKEDIPNLPQIPDHAYKYYQLESQDLEKQFHYLI